MKNMHKLPFISGTLAAIMVGMTSYINGEINQGTYIKMAVGMIIFYILGVYIRETVTKVQDDVRIKREKEELEKQMEQKKQKELENPGSKKSSTIDFKISDDDGFSPLTVSKVIKTKMDQ